MNNEMTVVATFDQPAEAALARNYLEAHDVPAVLADDETVGMAWHLTTAVGGVKLVVARRDAERALALLQDRGGKPDQRKPPQDRYGTTDDLAADDEDWDADEENDEEDEPLSPADETADRAFRAAVAGLLLCPLQLYSLWLLASLLTMPEPPSPRMRRRAWIAAILDTAFFAYALYFFALSW